ncbi:DUF3040 domain-containing protein [Streptomyces ureilyticus]|uniref:DUF3040 domain-containing protein n=1 Tax=Streptomyces ureilyticus TaxID=1775131 RepID=A0ABX0E8M1_9ACTN|nr:DUF3040 domain-containing protein [Streptomyces ureilyticus]NGO49298.1 DUF3040 domain-containing protein [Streptomyces ureilyticus]
MAHFDDEHLRDLEARMRRDDPRFAKALGSGRPCRPREYRHGRAWLVLAIALACLGVGMALPQGILIAVGLVLAGAAGHLFDPQRARPRGNDPPATR